jgi:hypothetical protein
VRRAFVGVVATAAALGVTGIAVAQITGGVPDAQPRAGSPSNVVATGYHLRLLAAGDDPLENPAGIYTRYGYLNDSAQQADHQDTKTEPDQNTYLVTDNPGGPTDGYDYGHHFLIQGHEVFASTAGVSHAYLTRVNLDVADEDHRITLLNTPGADDNTGMTSIDGSTYDPYTGQLLFTAEAGSSGGVFATPLKWSSTKAPAVAALDGSLGKGGYEGIHNDKLGNLYVIEDTGGSGVTDNGTATKVKQPNSFVYRFVPKDKGDLTKGVLQALQISDGDTPITFHDAATDPAGARDDALGDAILHLHSGDSLTAKWIPIHDTATDGTDPFDANKAAKAKGATPLKRPENGKFVPGTDFGSFVVAETGDTDQKAGTYPGAAERGAWGAILRIDMKRAGADDAKVKTIVLGDATHASFDNVAFLDKSTLLATEDRGDTLHQQLNALDSLWSFDITKPLAKINADAQRLVAQGRDPAASADAALHDQTPSGTHNDGDNELTGIHVSDGSTQPGGILGAYDPGKTPGVRIFVTGQHGANRTYEITAGSGKGHH